VLAAPIDALAWGSRTHEIINRRAVDRLPEPARSAWAPLAAKLGAHANDADRRKMSVPGERTRHFIDLDVYEAHPFDGVSRDRAALEKARGREFVERWGVVPWAIEECYRAVVFSLREGDWASAGAWAADLGHYVADSHQPLHCTKNYDGQNTGNDGIHLRFEVTMMDRNLQESMLGESGGPSPVPDGPVEMCFDWMAEAYVGLEPILSADSAARTLDPGFGDAYYEALWTGTREVAVLQTDRAVRDFASLLQSAWEEAGSPTPPEEVPSFRAKPLPEPEIAQEPRSRPVGLTVAATALGVVLAALLASSI
jgi:hypothetical protein